MEIKNYLEEFVEELAKEQLQKVPELAGNERALMDVMALALNNLKPMYVVSDAGHILTEVKLSSEQIRAKVLVAVLQAIDTVKRNPRI
ncbi:late competence development ComFB family protein [candidate division WOR-3 bacterium]|nr:late competence development ComFB family protein [candidate division WOR-3 bacterium]